MNPFLCTRSLGNDLKPFDAIEKLFLFFFLKMSNAICTAINVTMNDDRRHWRDVIAHHPGYFERKMDPILGAGISPFELPSYICISACNYNRHCEHNTCSGFGRLTLNRRHVFLSFISFEKPKSVFVVIKYKLEINYKSLSCVIAGVAFVALSTWLGIEYGSCLSRFCLFPSLSLHRIQWVRHTSIW